ncbi:MAG TPA: CDP-alcohol phosphatidyltransferase family protein [Bryobacteraceae bacterium]|nr:CDP-alcohol phosphatidyltransferase family protein [Bryobacteraceae bacterium]
MRERSPSVLNLPNLFTLARLVLTPFIAADIVSGRYAYALVLLFIAGLTDVIDGYLARRLKSATPAGAYFDPVADKILLSAVYIALGFAGAIPWWMMIVVFGRDLLILAMAGYGLLFTRHRKFPPSVWGKISTFCQIGAALVVMGARAGVAVPDAPALYLMVLATVWSGTHYVWRAVVVIRQTAH